MAPNHTDNALLGGTSRCASSTQYIPAQSNSEAHSIPQQQRCVSSREAPQARHSISRRTAPMIIPPTSRLSHLVISSCHLRTLHGGVQLTLALLRQRFWASSESHRKRHFAPLYHVRSLASFDPAATDGQFAIGKSHSSSSVPSHRTRLRRTDPHLNKQRTRAKSAQRIHHRLHMPLHQGRASRSGVRLHHRRVSRRLSPLHLPPGPL
jgi:hypothetical protein